MSFKIGTVTHYFDKLKVAIIELDAPLSIGERVRFSRGGEDIVELPIESMQVEHTKVESAKSGQIIGVQVPQEIKAGSEVYKV